MFRRPRRAVRPARSRSSGPGASGPGASGKIDRRPAPVELVGVTDGDSLTVRRTSGRDREAVEIRLFAVDAPEWNQSFGAEAREFLTRAIQGRNDLIMEAVDTDRYGRLVAVIYRRRDGRRRSVNRLLVQQGLARWYSSYGGEDLGLPQAERDARRHRRGLWRQRNAVAPWEHRAAQRPPRPAARRRARLGIGCLIWAAVITAVLLAVVWGLN